VFCCKNLSIKSTKTIIMGNLPKEQRAAVKQGEGRDAKAPVQKVPVPEPGPGQILVRNPVSL
jgi:hypothetical protein